MTSLITNLNGQYKSCGVGQGFSLQLQCNGPNCGALLDFPNLQCQTVSGGQSCNNGVTCKQTSNSQPSSSSGAGSAPLASLNSSGVGSSFIIQQDPQTGQTTSNQHLDIQGQSIVLNASSNGTASFKYGDITVSNNGTTSPSAPASTGKSSSSPKTYPLSNLFLIALVFLGMFVGQINAQGVTWNDVLLGLPEENILFLESLEPQLCESTIPVINSAVCGGQQSFLGVADITRICLQTVGEAPQPDTATGSNASQLIFALGNTIACDQIANAMLNDPEGLTGRELCNPYIPFSTCTTSVFTTEFTSSGIILVSTLSELSQSSAASGSAAPAASSTATSAGASSQAAASPAVVSPSVTVTSTAAASQASSSNAVSGGVASAKTVSSAQLVSIPIGSSTAPSTSTGNATVAIKHRRFGGMVCEDERL